MTFSKNHILLFVLLFSSCVSAPLSLCEADFITFLEGQNAHFADPEQSPLPKEHQLDFEYLNYHAYDEAYCLSAQLIRSEGEKPFEMSTSTDRKPVYIKYGELKFELDGQALSLAAYKNVELSQKAESAHDLFVPFNDLSNAVTSYGGGRYLDLKIPASEDIVLDFNQTYHPYCAYNHIYSCPIPPDENMLPISVNAGVKSGINGLTELEEH